MNFGSEYVFKNTCKRMGPYQYDDIEEPSTNVVNLNFDFYKLDKSCEIQTGDPLKCENCDAILSSFNQFKSETKSWKCLFCDYGENKVLFEEEMLTPKQDVTTYLQVKKKSNCDKYVVFCVDISGNMNSIEKNRRVSVTHKTHLSDIQSVIEQNLETRFKESSGQTVILVTFNNLVKSYVYRNDTVELQEITIQTNEMESNITIENYVDMVPFDLLPIRQTYFKLKDKITTLRADGNEAALGPALLFSILLASRKQGSKVILCTHGLGNIGLGSYLNFRIDFQFYKKLTTFAKNSGVSVSVQSMQVEKSNRMVESFLPHLASVTKGVYFGPSWDDEGNLQCFINKTTNTDIIATEVEIRFIAHHSMFLKDSENSNRHFQPNVILKTIGTIRENYLQAFYFGFQVINDSSNNDMQIELPFQVQIQYLAKDGSRYLKVRTKMMPVTVLLDEVEESCNRTVISNFFIKTWSNRIRIGYTNSRNFSRRRKLHLDYLKYLGNLNPNDNFSIENYLQHENNTFTGLSISNGAEISVEMIVNHSP